MSETEKSHIRLKSLGWVAGGCTSTGASVVLKGVTLTTAAHHMTFDLDARVLALSADYNESQKEKHSKPQQRFAIITRF